MGEVGHAAAAADARYEFDDAVYHHEPFSFQSDGWKNKHNDVVRMKQAERKQQAEYRTRSAYRIGMRITGEQGGRHTGVGSGSRILYPVHPELYQPGPDTADDVIGEETPAAEVVFQSPAEHPQGEHIEEDMPEIGMQEHIGQRLPDMEIAPFPETQRPEFEQRIAYPSRQQYLRQKDENVYYQQVRHYGRGSESPVSYRHDNLFFFRSHRPAGRNRPPVFRRHAATFGKVSLSHPVPSGRGPDARHRYGYTVRRRRAPP